MLLLGAPPVRDRQKTVLFDGVRGALLGATEGGGRLRRPSPTVEPIEAPLTPSNKTVFWRSLTGGAPNRSTRSYAHDGSGLACLVSCAMGGRLHLEGYICGSGMVQECRLSYEAPL